MADCNYDAYNALRNETSAAANASQAACVAVNTAEQALVDAQGAYDEALANEAAAKDAWQAAERAENEEAARLGIDPIPETPAPTQIPSRR